MSRRHRLAVLFVSLLVAAAPASGAGSPLRDVRPPASPQAARYSQAVVVERGPLIFVSGQVAHDSRRRVAGEGDMRAQTRQVFQDVKAVLEVRAATSRTSCA